MKKKYITPEQNTVAIKMVSIIASSGSEIVVSGNKATIEADPESNYGGMFYSREFDYDEEEE